MRPFPPQCRWIDDLNGSHLQWHYKCVGSVVRRRYGWEVQIRFGERSIDAPAASLAQGKRYLGRWVAAHGLPSIRRKDRGARPVRTIEEILRSTGY